MKLRRIKRTPVDRKSWITYAILNFINLVSVKKHFVRFEIEGRERLPKGSFILIANHSARWDGPVVQQLIKRPANYMVAPNELRGFQGLLLRAIGAFPADPRLDLLSFMRKQAQKAEPIVIFPEGDIYRDGSTHAFKKGAARIAMMCAANGLDVPIVPVAIKYDGTAPDVVRVLVGETVDVSDSVTAYKQNQTTALHNLTLRLHREVCHLKAALGCKQDQVTVFDGKPVRQWVPRVTRQDLAQSVH
jgi:1-acyl-sn-glycerol-3-phosphate acyltransferase